ncbi:KIF4 [Mytilus coruscus]|uniref:KIF4 n=1 Tax=Mytilus coruscus TaxID=42192 RepID=A0A6J8CJ49_MYTCO|nr:KIF4 [Mytilus coruscus]
MKGLNIVSCLIDSLAELKKFKTCTSHDENTLEEKVQIDDANVLKKAAEIIKLKIQTSCKNIKNSTNRNLSNFKFHNFIENTIDPILWNFLCALIGQETELQLPFGENSISDDSVEFSQIFNICCCLIFNRDSKCNKFQMLIADIIDKFTNSSTDCFNLLNKFCICVSKQTYERYQTQIVEERKSNSMNSSKCQFQIASVDNINKRSSYSAVKSTDAHRGFDGTSIQLVIPKPSIELLPEEKQQYLKGNIYLYGKDEYRSINLFQDNDSKVISLYKSIAILMNYGLLTSERDNDGICTSDIEKIMENCLTNTVMDQSLREILSDPYYLSDENFSKVSKFSPDEHINHELYLFNTRREADLVDLAAVSFATGCYEQCDNKDTVKHSLEILHQNLNVGQDINHLVVVGDGKTYDLLVKLKGEYGSELDWVLPFPGDWHILKNYQRMLMKLYLDAGLKDFIEIFHQGATANSVIQAVNFDKTHNFLLQFWESLFRFQIETVIKYFHFNHEQNDHFIHIKRVSDILSDNTLSPLEKIQKEMQFFPKFSFEYEELLGQLCEENENWRFWNTFLIEVHLVFDDQSPPLSPKDIERNRHDLKNENTSGISFTKSSKLPSDWLKFLTNRNNKKQLVLLISEQFLLLSQNAIKLNQTFVVGGGFDNSSLSKCVVQNEILIIKNFQTNISDGDSRVWLHTEKTLCDTVLIYSPDNDTYNIGLPFIQTLDKQVFVQLTFKKDVIYLNMNKLTHAMKNDPDLQCLSNDNHDNIPLIFQMLYIVTGCDYVSFFRDHGKTSFYQIFFKYPDFITSNNIVKGWLGILSDSDNTENAGFLAFLRLVGCEYWRKCSSAFLKDRIESPHYLFQSVFVETLSPLENHFIWLSKIRDALYCRVPSEEFFLPSNDALFLHWKRSCWQANQNFVHYPILNDHGWKIEKNVLSIVWDSDENLEKISNNIKLWTAGCGCLKSNCSGNQCGCRKQRKSCGPGCKCGQSCLNSNGPTMLPSGDANIQQPNEKTQVEHLYDSESDTDTDSDNMTFNDIFLEFENLGINLVELDESDLQTVITDFNTYV